MKKLSSRLKANQRGFSHHLLIPAIVVVLIAGVGVWLLTRSHAEPLANGVTPSASVSCSPTFNSFNGNGYKLWRSPSTGQNHYTISSSPDYEIILKCGSGGLGHVWYRNVKTGSQKMIVGWSGQGCEQGAADIAMAPLPSQGFFSLAVIRRTKCSGEPWQTDVTAENYDVHGNFIGYNTMFSNAPFDHIIKYTVTATHNGMAIASDVVFSSGSSCHLKWDGPL